MLNMISEGHQILRLADGIIHILTYKFSRYVIFRIDSFQNFCDYIFEDQSFLPSLCVESIEPF